MPDIADAGCEVCFADTFFGAITANKMVESIYEEDHALLHRE